MTGREEAVARVEDGMAKFRALRDGSLADDLHGRDDRRLLIASALGVVVARGISRSLSRVKNVRDGLAAGDLTRSSGLTSRDEPGQMGRALDDALVNLRAHRVFTSPGVTETEQATQELARMSSELTILVSNFRY